MRQKLIKKAIVLAMALFILTPVLAFSLPALAEKPEVKDLWGSDDIRTQVNTDLGLGEKDPRVIVASVINVILGFLGIIAVVIILLGGFKWMTAGGSEHKIGEAKKLITAGVIGLVIILASWGIATFVITGLISATSTP